MLLSTPASSAISHEPLVVFTFVPDALCLCPPPCFLSPHPLAHMRHTCQFRGDLFARSRAGRRAPLHVCCFLRYEVNPASPEADLPPLSFR